MNEQLLAIVPAEIAQCRDEGFDKSDTLHMAIEACVRYGREIGVIGEDLSNEMRAALEVLARAAMNQEALP